MDIVRWLRSLGLGQYEATFRESEIDADILPELTDQDLEKLGVPLGHRKRFSQGRSAPWVLRTTRLQPFLLLADQVPTPPERRQVTVMFSDLVGSQCSPRAWTLRTYGKSFPPTRMRRRHRAALRGFVAKYMGDGVLIYFGYPQAHEDDAERAVRAGLELVAAIAA